MVEKARIDISVILPAVPDTEDACVGRLRELLEAKTGIDTAHVLEADKERPGQICIHFDPELLSLGEIRDLAHRVGADLDRQFGHLLLKSQPMHARQARSRSDRLRQIEGVLEAAVSPDGIARIEFQRERISRAALIEEARHLGIYLHEEEHWRALHEDATDPHEAEEEAHDNGGILGDNSELIFALVCGGLLLAGWLLSLSTELSSWIAWTFYALSYVFGGYYTTREAVEKTLVRRFEIDFLMLVAAAGAAALGQWAEGALLLFLFSLGHSLEHYAMGRARRAIEALSELAPDSALVRRDGEVEEVPVEELKTGETVIVKPDERIPADGFVCVGRSSVDQSPITGESVPVDKQPVPDPENVAGRAEDLAPVHRVFAGTINGSGSLEIRVTKLARDTTLARVVRMVTEAETQQSPTQRFADRFERVFVPSVLGLVFVLLFAWTVIDEPFRDSFYRAMAVLVAASPCALAIATPSAVLSAVARAGRGGVLVKGGGPLEGLGTLRSIAFDKTGTLTAGRPRLTDVVTAEDASERELLSTAIAVERLSHHPLAAAVVRDGRERLDGDDIPEATSLENFTGRGVRAQLRGEPVLIGKSDLFDQLTGPAVPPQLAENVARLETQGRTTMIVCQDGRFLGVLGLMDTPRPAAAAVVNSLRKLGIERIVMISGDNQRVADAVASELKLNEARGNLMPEDKVETIKRLRAQGDVAMVGDGVNDAPAMANATVGIAMGAAGSDVALETADVALMADDLTTLPFAVGLSRQTSRIIRQNLWMSLGMVTLLIPATIFGLRIGPAVALHEGSTLVVVFNALRLLAYQPPNTP